MNRAPASGFPPIELVEFGVGLDDPVMGCPRMTCSSGLHPALMSALLRDDRGLVVGKRHPAQGEKLDAVTGQITALTEGNERRQEALRANVETKLGELKTDAGLSAKALREEITNNLQNLSGALCQNIEQISQSQRERLDRVSVSLSRFDPAERGTATAAKNRRGTT